jgi:hypothetical protein
VHESRAFRDSLCHSNPHRPKFVIKHRAMDTQLQIEHAGQRIEVPISEILAFARRWERDQEQQIAERTNPTTLSFFPYPMYNLNLNDPDLVESWEPVANRTSFSARGEYGFRNKGDLQRSAIDRDARTCCNERMLPPIYTVMAATNGTYVWRKLPGEPSYDITAVDAAGIGERIAAWDIEPPISPELEADFIAWQARFRGDHRTPECEPVGGWRDFNKQGMALAIRLKQRLGSIARVRYVAATFVPEFRHGRWWGEVSEKGLTNTPEEQERVSRLLTPLDMLAPARFTPELAKETKRRAICNITMEHLTDAQALRHYRSRLGIFDDEPEGAGRAD